MAKPIFRQYPISEEIECTCKFYTSTDKENGITGTLTYQHNRGIFINLMNPIAFVEGMILYAESANLNHFAIYNVTRRVGLMDEDDEEAHGDKNKLLNGEFMLMSVTSSSFPKKDAFDSISFELVDLWKWFPNGKKFHSHGKSKKRKFVSLPIMPEFSITSSTGRTITFKNEPVDNIILKGVRLEQKPDISIKYSSKKSFKDLMLATLSFRKLFQLLTGGYGAFAEIFIHSGLQKYRVFLVDENSEINLKWGSVSMFLHFAKIKSSLPKILDNWESIQNEISQVIDILIMEHNNFSLSPE